jgi:acetyltransferase-like isoleucine patch superfamily enzyme
MKQIFQQLFPGKKLVNDWCDFPVPENIVVGVNTMIDSSFCFEKYFSEKKIGLKLGDNITIQKSSLATELNGYIEIGDYSFISCATIIANESVSIGNYVFIGNGVTIVDTDFHPLDPAKRLQDTIAISTVGDKSRRPAFVSMPVVVEDDVWIGFNASILKGVTIGKGSIIQPGSVVLKDIPAGSIVAGNPARIISNRHE